MKKILAMMLLAMFVAFTGCDSSGDTAASAEEQAMAEQMAQSFGLAMKNAVSMSIPASGISLEEESRAAASGITASGGVISGSYTQTINEVSGSTSVTGSLTLNIVSGSYDAFGNVTISATFTGSITAISDGITYTMTFALEMNQSGSGTATVTGYITVNGAKATISETV